jgi:hypothetical protein
MNALPAFFWHAPITSAVASSAQCQRIGNMDAVVIDGSSSPGRWNLES